MKSSKTSFFKRGWLFASLLTFTLMYSATAENWTQKADMPIPRLFFSVAAADGEVYTIGGMLAEPVDFVMLMTRVRTNGSRKRVYQQHARVL